MPFAGIDDFEGEEFYGFCSDFEQRKEKFTKNREKQLKAVNIYNFDFWRDYGRMTRSEIESRRKGKELTKQIELSFGFGELGEILNNSEEDKIWLGNQELIRQESVGSQLHTIQEEREIDFGTVISGDLGNSGIIVRFWNKRKPTLIQRRWGMFNWEG